MKVCPRCSTRTDGDFCPNCGCATVNEAPAPAPAPAPQYQQPYQQPVNRPMTAADLPVQYKPLGAWAYFGYTLLFSIPIVGFIMLIVFSLSDTNINRRNFARSFWCWLVVGIIVGIITGVIIAINSAAIVSWMEQMGRSIR